MHSIISSALAAAVLRDVSPYSIYSTPDERTQRRTRLHRCSVSHGSGGWVGEVWCSALLTSAGIGPQGDGREMCGGWRRCGRVSTEAAECGDDSDEVMTMNFAPPINHD